MGQSCGSTRHIAWVMVIGERVLDPHLLPSLLSVRLERREATEPLREQKQWMERPLNQTLLGPGDGPTWQ